MASTATIRLKDLELVLFAAQMRRRNHGQTAQLCALSESPMIQPDCHLHNVLPRHIKEAQQYGQSQVRSATLTRGHIAHLIQRTRIQHGLPEVRKTWGTGIRALLKENHHILNGGKA